MCYTFYAILIYVLLICSYLEIIIYHGVIQFFILKKLQNSCKKKFLLKKGRVQKTFQFGNFYDLKNYSISI